MERDKNAVQVARKKGEERRRKGKGGNQETSEIRGKH